MKRLFTILLLTILSSYNCTYGQLIKNLFNKDKSQEKEVKISGKYYYGEGLDENLKTAQANAFDDLKLMILEEAMEHNTELTNADFKGFEEDMETMVFELEGRVKVIMFLAKNKVKFESTNNRKFFIIRNTNRGANVVPKEEPTTAADNTQEEKKQEAEPKIITITSGTTTTTSTTTTSTTAASTSRPATSRPTSTTTRPSQTTDTETSSTTKRPETSNPNSYQTSYAARKTNNSIINQLLSIKQYEEARQILNNNKVNGKLMYGQLATLSNPHNCYFLVIDNREVIDILDKYNGSNNQSLLTGNIVDYRTTQGVVLWITIL